MTKTENELTLPGLGGSWNVVELPFLNTTSMKKLKSKASINLSNSNRSRLIFPGIAPTGEFLIELGGSLIVNGLTGTSGSYHGDKHFI